MVAGGEIAQRSRAAIGRLWWIVLALYIIVTISTLAIRPVALARPWLALGVGAASGFAAAIVGIFYLVKYCRLRMHIGAGRLRFSHDGGNGMMQRPWG